MSTAEATTYAAMSPEELVAEQEEHESEIRRLGLLIDNHRAANMLIDASLITKLGDGEAVQAPSGRIRFKESGPLGSARVNVDALTEHYPATPEDLWPKTKTVYCGVGDIRRAAKEGRLPPGTTAETFLIPAPEGSVLRWRTLGTDAA